jgi:hypothetical protein
LATIRRPDIEIDAIRKGIGDLKVATSVGMCCVETVFVDLEPIDDCLGGRRTVVEHNFASEGKALGVSAESVTGDAVRNNANYEQECCPRR